MQSPDGQGGSVRPLQRPEARSRARTSGALPHITIPTSIERLTRRVEVALRPSGRTLNVMALHRGGLMPFGANPWLIPTERNSGSGLSAVGP